MASFAMNRTEETRLFPFHLEGKEAAIGGIADGDICR
jgi:hypothetical protein